MSVIATFLVDSDSFPLGKSIENQPTAKIEIERIVPMRQETFPFIFVWNLTDFEQFEDTMRSLPGIDIITRLETFEDGRLYKIEWESETSPLLPEIKANNGVLLSASGNASAWTFEIRFSEHTHVSQFFQEVTEESDVEIKLKTLIQEVKFESTDDQSLLTAKQEAALRTAFESGYYDVPRGAHLDDVAAALEISPSATSSLLRRGSSRFFKHHFSKD